jgi:hypothetical protein
VPEGIRLRKCILFWAFVLEEGSRYALPSFFKYFLDLRSPIREAFFLTASVLRLSCLAILEVGLLGNSFFSSATSAGFHPPLGAFFFAAFFFTALMVLVESVPLFRYVNAYNLCAVFWGVKYF